LIKIIEASESDLTLVRELFTEYANSLGFDLGFQSFNDELNQLPGHYSPPFGSILLAFHDSKIAGCVAVKKIESDIAEMKRLYVRPDFQGKKIGRGLAEEIISIAKQKGYKRIRLDTVPSMKAAISLYQSLGFHSIPAYRENPIKGSMYLEKALS
jgi:ribosomal protein S18 acetylase RimI-like enzyme